MSWLENFKYRIRTEKPKLMQRLDDNTYYGGNLGGITVTKKRKKPYKWVSPRGAGNMTVMPGDPEMIFFAPIAAGAGIAASPAISSVLGNAVSGINTAGDALAATTAGQRLTSGLNFVGNAVKSSKAWPWIDAGLTSIFGAHGIDKVRRGDIHNVGDVVETGLDLLPLSQLARPVVNTAGRISNTVENGIDRATTAWKYRGINAENTPSGLLSNTNPLVARGGYEVARYPGYLLKGLMGGSPLERQLSKNGTININLLNTYFNKASQLEREVVNKVLTEKFAGLKTIDYNLFKKAVLDELIGNYNRNYNALSMIPTMTTARMMAYGGDRLGIIKNFKDIPDGSGGLVTTWTEESPVLFKQFTFETPKISIGNRKHYSGQPIGHTRTFTNQQEPLILHVMESQSDWAQKPLGLTKAEKTAIQNIDEQLKTGTPTGFSTLEGLQVQKQAILDRVSQRTLGISYLSLHLHDNYLQRQLQENLRYAAENGLTKMRYPTSETAAKIEGYLKNVLARTPEEETEMLNLFKEEMTLRSENPNSPRLKEISDRMNEIGNGTKKTYPSEHQTILKKYSDFPKLFLKLYKGRPVRIVTDAKGNTWYEVDVPENYLNMEWQFKKGGQLISRNVMTRFKNENN